MIYTYNRKKAYFVMLLATILSWYGILLMTQKEIKIKKRHCIALGFALAGYTLWWFKFIYLVKTN